MISGIGEGPSLADSVKYFLSVSSVVQKIIFRADRFVIDPDSEILYIENDLDLYLMTQKYTQPRLSNENQIYKFI